MRPGTRAVALFFLLLVQAAALAAPAVRANGPVTSWVVLGPFANPLAPEGRSATARGGFDVDYLAPLGGEAKATLTAATTVAGVTAREVKTPDGHIDFAALYPENVNKLAYAFTMVQAATDEDVTVLLGSDDGAKVWVNGTLVHEVFVGRAFASRQDRFRARLQRGANTLLVKVENGTGGWELGVELVGGAALRKMEAAEARARRTRAVMDLEVGPFTQYPGWVFPVPDFPRLGWRDPDGARELVGNAPLKVRWFDSSFAEVTRAEKPGRYLAVVEAKLRGGSALRRCLSFTAVPAGTWGVGEWRAALANPGAGLTPITWAERRPVVEAAVGQMVSEATMTTHSGARLIAWLQDAKPLGRQARFVEGPEVVDLRQRVALKRRTTPDMPTARPLAPPRKRASGPAPVIREGTAAEAGVVPDARDRINEAARKWEQDSGEPFAVLVARHGVIVAHAGFGSLGTDGPCTVDFRNEVASITKAVSGILFSQFVDQGLAAIDDPIGKFLPGYPLTGQKALTFRHCFTHTSGLSGHGEWGGIWNPDLDNVILSGLPTLEPSVRHNYNGMGYDLAGRAMENITGKCIVDLFTDHLFTPLGFTDVPINDMAFGAHLTARELAVLGQWLANRGSYGDLEFVSPKTYEQMLPRQLEAYWPAIKVEWGIGLTHMPSLRPGVTGQPRPQDYALGPKTIGHGSATSCVLRVDPDQDLVIAMIRRTAGPRYDANLAAFCAAVADTVVK